MITITSVVLTIIGAINWLIVGIAQFDLVAYVFGGASSVGARIVYILVGLAGVWLIGVMIARGGHVEADQEHHQQ